MPASASSLADAMNWKDPCMIPEGMNLIVSQRACKASCLRIPAKKKRNPTADVRGAHLWQEPIFRAHDLQHTWAMEWEIFSYLWDCSFWKTPILWALIEHAKHEISLIFWHARVLTNKRKHFGTNGINSLHGIVVKVNSEVGQSKNRPATQILACKTTL